MSEIFVIGMDSYDLSPEKHKMLLQCQTVAAADRFSQMLAGLPLTTIPIAPLQSSLNRIEESLEHGNVAVLASGDPLFFGIGAKLLQRFDRDTITFIPAISSIQEAAARFKLPWHDAEILSLHGRNAVHLPGVLLSSSKTFVFTDKHNSPDILASKIVDYLTLIDDPQACEKCVIHIAEDIGTPSERVRVGKLTEIAGMRFSPLNVVCITRPHYSTYSRFGLDENDIAHSRGLITKNEVRAASLHRLRLPQQGVFWDIGGGSGSLSIEAALLNPKLTIFTIERKAEELQNIKKNIRNFRCYNVVPVTGEATGCLAELPSPDAVFVGGSGGQLQDILYKSVLRLKYGGTVVVNGVTEQTITQAPLLMKENGLQVETSKIEVSRTGRDGSVSFNPIFIMAGRK